MTRDARETRTCTNCGVTKSATEFYVNSSGYPRLTCKACELARARAYRGTPASKAAHAAHWQKRRADPSYRAWLKEYNRARRPPPKSETLKEKARRARERDPEKTAARQAVSAALKRGDLVRPDQCERCGSPNSLTKRGRPTIQAHHDDYSRPLDVQWLCVSCHTERHVELGDRISLEAAQ